MWHLAAVRTGTDEDAPFAPVDNGEMSVYTRSEQMFRRSMLTPQPPDDGLVATMAQLEDECRKIGLYLMGFVVGAAPSDEHMSVEAVEFVMTTFLVGAEAFDDRVLNPKAHEEDTTVRRMDDELDSDEAFIEEMKRRKREGKGILDDD